jgi:uncharacterized protein (DUF1778 family)
MSETKTQRVHLRVAASDDRLFRSAAAAADESLSEFLVESGRERAERVLANRTRFVLSPARWRAFPVAPIGLLGKSRRWSSCFGARGLSGGAVRRA